MPSPRRLVHLEGSLQSTSPCTPSPLNGGFTSRLVPWTGCTCLAYLGACEGPQSSLDPAGRDAEIIARLFWWMTAGAAAVWAVVMGLAVCALFASPSRAQSRLLSWMIVGGGALVPTLLLTSLLLFGLSMMPELLDRSADNDVRIHVAGEQWWWRVRYEWPDGTSFQLANELRLPVLERTPLWLYSVDVVHSFWVPALAGKVDMIPGRTNRLAIEPTRSGRFRGACAEYCGTSHAGMQLDVVVNARPRFERWAKRQKMPAQVPASECARRGAVTFSSLGCGACHSIRGTKADGELGPDLTHVGSRSSLAAGVLDNDVPAFERWLSEPKEVKPGAHMPAFDMLSQVELHCLATYLDGLQ